MERSKDTIRPSPPTVVRKSFWKTPGPGETSRIFLVLGFKSSFDIISFRPFVMLTPVIALPSTRSLESKMAQTDYRIRSFSRLHLIIPSDTQFF
jgi:hypothetical protein